LWVYDAMQCWTFRRICVWSPWQVHTHFTYIAGRNNSDTILTIRCKALTHDVKNAINGEVECNILSKFFAKACSFKKFMFIVSITVYDAMQCWTFRRICVWSPWQVYTHFTYIAGRNNSDTILSVIFIAFFRRKP
jgi:hypothetical protein